MGRTKVLIWDPCPLGQPIILTVAHMAFCVLLRASQGSIAPFLSLPLEPATDAKDR